MDWLDIGIDISKAKGGGDWKKMPCARCDLVRAHPGQPDLAVNLAEGCWRCHNCGWTGKLDARPNGFVDLPKPQKSHKKPVYRLTPLPENVVKWFAKRGIPESILAKNSISYGPFPLAPKEKQAIQFPYMRYGEVVNVKYRTHDKKFCMHTGAQLIPYRLDSFASDHIIIVEGEIDALSVELAGYDSVTSVPNGAPPPDTKNYDAALDFINAAESLFMPMKKIIMAGDNDTPGRRLTEELVRRFGAERCWLVDWPQGCKDANDVLVAYGPEKIKECIEDAKPWPINGLSSIRDIEQRLWDMFNNGISRGLSTGWPNLDKLYTIRPGEVTTIGGVPGHMKSTVMSAMMVHLAKTYQWRFLVYSPEHPQDRMAATIIQQWAGKPFGGPYSMSQQELARAYYESADSFTWILGEDEDPTVDYLLSLAKIEVYRKGIKGFVIDPWNEIDSAREKGMTETEFVAKHYRNIRRFAQNHGVHIWIIAHPTKLQKAQSGKYAGKYPPPTAYDFSGGANFRNKSTNILTVWRDTDSDSKVVEVHVQKVKFPEIGHIGATQLLFDYNSARFSPCEPEEPNYSDSDEDFIA